MVLFEAGHCHYCNKELFGGRSDRRFCSDICRNAFNRERRKDEAKLFGDDVRQKIFKIISRNYELLLKFNLLQEKEVIVDKQKLYEAGFNFAYCTSAKLSRGVQLKRYIFEQTWIELEYGQLALGVEDAEA